MNLLEYLRAWFHRKPGLQLEMPPIPPLPLGCPDHERPDVPLTLHEKITFGRLAELSQDLEALDPGERP